MSGLPDRPDLDQLRRQARELLRAATSGEPHAAGRLRGVSPRLTLSAAQLALAREYGFQYLRARPRWRNYNQAGQREREVSVHAADDRGGSYQGSYARDTKVITEYATEEEYFAKRFMGPEELALQFLPCLDPLARALKLTFQGAREEITVDLEIGGNLR